MRRLNFQFQLGLRYCCHMKHWSRMRESGIPSALYTPTSLSFVSSAVYYAQPCGFACQPLLARCITTKVTSMRRQILSFTICRILYPRKHKCRCIQQRHLNKERNFFGGESVLCIGKISLPHLLYTVYQIFWCTQIFVGFFDGNKKSA